MRQVLRYGLIAVALVVTAVHHQTGLWPALTSPIELGLRDTMQHALASDKDQDDVVLVDIHEQSLQAVGPWPWSRQTLAELVDNLINQYQARIVVLDIVLPTARDPRGDQALARLAEEKKLVLSEVFDYLDREPPLASGMPSSGMPLSPESLAAAPLSAKGYLANHAGLARAPCVGNISFLPDRDGKLRQLPLLTDWQGQLHFSLAAAALECLGLNPLKGLPREALQQSQYRLRFAHHDTSWIVIPADMLLDQTLDADPALLPLLRDRIVIVGASALGLSDRVATPLSSSISGMFVHAQLLSELLKGQTQRLRPPIAMPYSLLAHLGLVLALAIGLLRSRGLAWLAGSAVAVVLSWGLLAAWQTSTGAVAPITPALWGFAVLALGLIPWEWIEDRRQARSTRRLLSRYVAPDVLKEILRSRRTDQASLLAPQSTIITVLVADMAGYSEATKLLRLDQAATLTRSFLSAITRPVWQNRGTLDRYTGDGLVAFWGAPVPDPEHSLHALKAAQQMLEAVAALQAELTAQGLPAVSVRIGLAQGPALVGDFGTPYRAAYTAVGNCINLAARLEALAKEKGTAILMDQAVAQAAKGAGLVATQFLGNEAIRGFGAIALYGAVPPAGSGTG
ncbi:MAG: CHASE2 domain-containing protein [Burkholderiaceae bacterium]